MTTKSTKKPPATGARRALSMAAVSLSGPLHGGPAKRPTASVGKYRDANYGRFVLYLRRDTMNDVRRAIIGSGLDMSEFTDAALREKLARPPSSTPPRPR